MNRHRKAAVSKMVMLRRKVDSMRMIVLWLVMLSSS